jgi:DNA-binding NtrC family response regulator
MKQKYTIQKADTNLNQKTGKHSFPMTRILVIDDEKEIKQAYKTVLEKLDCQVDIADDGIDGLERFLNKIYDVVITDYNLETIDGLQMLEHFQHIDSKVPVIFSSGLADQDVIEEVMEGGAFDFIPKPANIEQLLMSISRAIYYKPTHKSDEAPMCGER